MLVAGRDHGQLRPGLLAAVTASRQIVPEPPVARIDTPAPKATAALTPARPVVLPLAMPLVQISASPETTTEVLAKGASSPVAEVWYVAAATVNVREGPSTDHAVIDKLARGEATTVIWAGDTGWAHIRIEGDGVEGYVSARFLTREAPGY
ncbi:MAG: SH3 domain-containing protein [Paracoccaceae bacterium]|nr:SH3 domain-containing protein [Paracoccaceae bacterium]